MPGLEACPGASRRTPARDGARSHGSPTVLDATGPRSPSVTDHPPPRPQEVSRLGARAGALLRPDVDPPAGRGRPLLRLPAQRSPRHAGASHRVVTDRLLRDLPPRSRRRVVPPACRGAVQRGDVGPPDRVGQHAGTPGCRAGARPVRDLREQRGGREGPARPPPPRDPTVRSLAGTALWAIWFRADTPENNEALERVRDLINRGKLDQAVATATQLIDRAPRFAEAYNQRAIAHFYQGHYEESAADCHRVLERNPYHFGALSGLAGCQLRLDQRRDALETFRRALKLRPFDDSLRDAVASLESEGR
jgi:hypothetical protein